MGRPLHARKIRDAINDNIDISDKKLSMKHKFKEKVTWEHNKDINSQKLAMTVKLEAVFIVKQSLEETKHEQEGSEKICLYQITLDQPLSYKTADQTHITSKFEKDPINNYPVKKLPDAKQHSNREQLFDKRESSQIYQCLQLLNQKSVDLPTFVLAITNLQKTCGSLSVFPGFISIVVNEYLCRSYQDVLSWLN